MCVVQNILTGSESNPLFQCDTLIKYLVDSLQSFENGHGSALHPIPIDPTNFFMGDDSSTKPATSEEVHQLAASVHRTVDTLFTTVHSALSQTVNASIPPPKNLNHLSQSTLGGQMESINVPGFGNARNSQIGPESTASCSSESVSSFEPQNSRSVSPSSLPMAGVSIPSLGRAPGAWRRAAKQWTEVDPQTGLALRDWPAKWYTGLMRTTTGSLRSQRQVIFEEYEQ
jgi:hypothetical protein